MLAFYVLLFYIYGVSGASKAVVDVNDNKGNIPFFLQDPKDTMCLGPKGFTLCDEGALWMLTKRPPLENTYSLVSFLYPSKKGLCLQRATKYFGFIKTDTLALGSCTTATAKGWGFDFVGTESHVKLSVGDMCIVRGKKHFKNSVSLQPCGNDNFQPLKYQPTSVHEAGFFLKTADGYCFSGSNFVPCDVNAQKLLFGIGIKYVRQEAHRYIFAFSVNDRSQCLVPITGSNTLGYTGTSRSDCKKNIALGWGLERGQLSYAPQAKCVARLNPFVNNTSGGLMTTTSAVLADCEVAFEHLTLEVPVVYSASDFAQLDKKTV